MANSLKETAMTDNVDSLARLQRLGSENSKTTDELIAAAREPVEFDLRAVQTLPWRMFQN